MMESVFEEVSAKTHDRNGLAKSICNRDSVLQKKWALMNEKVLRFFRVWDGFLVR